MLTSEMKLAPNVGSDRSWVYTAQDYSEGEANVENLAIRFGNTENAGKFKAKFEECQKVNQAILDGGEVPFLEEIETEVRPTETAEPAAASVEKAKVLVEEKKDDGYIISIFEITASSVKPAPK